MWLRICVSYGVCAIRGDVRFWSVALGKGKYWSVGGICRRMRDVAVEVHQFDSSFTIILLCWNN